MDTDAADKPDPAKVLAQAQAPRQHPPPLYYLPAILLPSQKAFLEKRKKEVRILTLLVCALAQPERFICNRIFFF